MIDPTTITDVSLCPWDTTGRPRLYVGRNVWSALVALLPFVPAEEPTALIVEVPGEGPRYVVRAKPIPILDPLTGNLVENYDWAPRPVSITTQPIGATRDA